MVPTRTPIMDEINFSGLYQAGNQYYYTPIQANFFGVKTISPPPSSDRQYAMPAPWNAHHAGLHLVEPWSMTKQYNTSW